MKPMKFVFGLLMGLTIAAGAAMISSSGVFENGTFRERVASQERYDFGSGSVYGLYRQSVFIPPDFGKLVSITQGETGTLFWYEAEDKTVRNVIVNSNQLLIIRRTGTIQKE